MAAADIDVGSRLPGRRTPDRDGSPPGSARRTAASLRLLCWSACSGLSRVSSHGNQIPTSCPIHDAANPYPCRSAARALRRHLLRRVGRHAQRPHGLRRVRRGAGALPRRRAARWCWFPTRRCRGGRRARAGENGRAARRLGRDRLLRRHRARAHRREGVPALASHRPGQPRQPAVRAPAGRRCAARARPTPSSAPGSSTRSTRRSRPTAR